MFLLPSLRFFLVLTFTLYDIYRGSQKKACVLFFRYISILPTIHLSLIIPPEEAIQLRVPGYKAGWSKTKQKGDTFKPKAPRVTDKDVKTSEGEDTGGHHGNQGVVRNNVDDYDDGGANGDKLGRKEPDFLTEEYIRKYYPYIDPEQIKQYYPRSRSEFILTVSLGFLSVICITYFVMLLYRYMCSRKYSKWRASWNKVPKNSSRNLYYKQMKETFPVVLRGHLQVSKNV